MNNSENKSFTQPLTMTSLNHTYNCLETGSLKDMNGQFYDDGDPKERRCIVLGAKEVLQKDMTPAQIEKAFQELENIWCKYKGFFEPLRHYASGKFWCHNLAILHWSMLVITYPQFAEVAKTIGKKIVPHDLDSVCELLNNKYPKQEVWAILETMFELGALSKNQNNKYVPMKIDYTKDHAGNPDPELEDEAALYIFNVVNAIERYKIIARTRLNPDESEYAVTKNSLILKSFFPFRQLFWKIPYDKNAYRN